MKTLLNVTKMLQITAHLNLFYNLEHLHCPVATNQQIIKTGFAKHIYYIPVTVNQERILRITQ